MAAAVQSLRPPRRSDLWVMGRHRAGGSSPEASGSSLEAPGSSLEISAHSLGISVHAATAPGCPPRPSVRGARTPVRWPEGSASCRPLWDLCWALAGIFTSLSEITRGFFGGHAWARPASLAGGGSRRGCFRFTDQSVFCDGSVERQQKSMAGSQGAERAQFNRVARIVSGFGRGGAENLPQFQACNLRRAISNSSLSFGRSATCPTSLGRTIPCRML